MTKTETRQWMKRIREDLREMEQALRADNWDQVLNLAQDASGAAAEIETALTRED